MKKQTQKTQTILPSQPQDTHPLKRQIQWLLLLRVIFLTLILTLNFFLQSTERAIIVPPLDYIANFIIAVYLFTIGSALLLPQVEKYANVAYGQLIVDAVLVTVLLYFSGCSQSIFTAIYFFPIIAGSIILPRIGGYALAFICTIGYAVVLVLEYHEYYPLFYYEFWYRPLGNILAVLNYVSIHAVSFFLAALLSTQLSRRLQKTEDALSQTSQEYDWLNLLYKQIFNDINAGIITVDSRGFISSFNPASEKITGYKASEVTGKHINEKLPVLNLPDQEHRRPVIDLTRKDGQCIPIACSLANLHVPVDYGHYQVITLQDLSEIKKMEDQVRQAEKMAVIGEMAAGVAHEFRNPLTAISGSAEVLRFEIENNSANERLMEIIVSECKRLEKKIDQFLLFSKPAQPEQEWIILHSFIDDVLLFLKQSKDWRDNCRTRIEIPGNMDCWADPQQLTQVFINLLHNSCTVLKGEEGEIRISASESTEEGGTEHINLTIADNGPGIPLKNIGRIFEPFFTTRADGTGLGLAIVKQIIESHNGSIGVTSIVGQGTEFTISLPLPP